MQRNKYQRDNSKDKPIISSEVCVVSNSKERHCIGPFVPRYLRSECTLNRTLFVDPNTRDHYSIIT
jgi:hypothetical protein